jgi:hypothetical protein
MKGLLFLSLVGAAIYALLVYSHDTLKDRIAEVSSNSQAQSDHTVGNHFSSWGNYLPTPASENSQSASSPDGDLGDQDTERQRGDRHQLARSADAQAAGDDASEPQTVSVEWAKVMLAASLHDQASVSSPTVRSYSPGTNLQVVRREGSWVLVSDPITREQGWVLDQCLASISGAGTTQAALESTTEPPSVKPAAKPKSIKAAAKSKTRSLASKRSKPAVQVYKPRWAKPNFRGSRDVARWDPWNIPWAGRVDRRRGFQPFLTGRFAQGQ